MHIVRVHFHPLNAVSLHFNSCLFQFQVPLFLFLLGFFWKFSSPMKSTATGADRWPTMLHSVTCMVKKKDIKLLPSSPRSNVPQENYKLQKPHTHTWFYKCSGAAFGKLKLPNFTSQRWSFYHANFMSAHTVKGGEFRILGDNNWARKGHQSQCGRPIYFKSKAQPISHLFSIYL